MSCPDCFSGTIHNGTPLGTVSTIHGLQTYIASPPNGSTPTGVVVMIPDAFGSDFVNNRLLCDKYAEKGFLVYLPDFMNGYSAPPEFIDLMEKKIRGPASWFTTLFFKPYWIAKAIWMVVPWLYLNRQSVCRPRIFNFFTQLRITPPESISGKLGAAGFCWGGYYSFLLARDAPETRVDTKPLIDCAFVAHPSMLKLPADVEAVSTTIPLSVAVGDKDHAMGMESVKQMKDILEKKGDDHLVTVLEGAKHGFAIRLDPEDDIQNKCAEKADMLAVEWFAKWLQPSRSS